MILTLNVSLSCHPKYTAMEKRVKEGKQANTVMKGW